MNQRESEMLHELEVAANDLETAAGAFGSLKLPSERIFYETKAKNLRDFISQMKGEA